MSGVGPAESCGSGRKEADELVAKLSFNHPTLPAIAKLLKKAGHTKHEQLHEAVADPILATPVMRADKSTYQVLDESKPLMHFYQHHCYMHQALEEAYRKCTDLQRFEWCSLMDGDHEAHLTRLHSSKVWRGERVRREPVGNSMGLPRRPYKPRTFHRRLRSE